MGQPEGFVVEARSQTYAGGGGSILAALPGEERISLAGEACHRLWYAGGLTRE